MTQHPSYALRPHRAALGMGWLVLVVILFGTIISSIGGTSSHGLAAFPTALHVTPFSSDESHEHVHEDEGIGLVTQSAGADHPHHHGADHSHDNAHALPVAWSSAEPQLPGWFGLVRPWIEMVQASRLERPPMG
ncbi:hypothetical protein BH10PSE16_BH10PSE16_10490 [soil metagenome]